MNTQIAITALAAGLLALGATMYYMGYRNIRGARHAKGIMLWLAMSVEGMALAGIAGSFASSFLLSFLPLSHDVIRTAILIIGISSGFSIVLSLNAYYRALRLHEDQMP